MGKQGSEGAEQTAGPTRTALTEPVGWERRPKLATALRALIALVPTAASFFVTFAIARYLPPTSIGLHGSLWWIGLISCGVASLLLVDRTLRQLLPLVALLRLSLIFPDQAPSRFSIALRTGTTRQLERRVKQVTSTGFPDVPQEQAEHLLELVAALSRHDRMTRGHCERVRAYTDLLAAEMQLEPADANRLRWAALAHDVGKIFVAKEILNNPNAPVGGEWEEIKSHTWLGDELVEPLRPWLGEWLDAVGQHHERWDGDGYPNGLRRQEIQTGARIVAVADAFDVMTSRRSYKKAMSAKLARAEIADKAGTQFDPDVARALMNISIGRLRFAIGPLTWLFNVPSATTAALTPVAAPTFTALTAATTTLAAATIGFVPTPDETLAFEDPIVVASPTPPTTTGPPEPERTDIVTVSPAPPTTSQPSTTAAPTTTQPPTTQPATTQPPTTQPTTTQLPTTLPPTTQPTTTQPPPTTSASPASTEPPQTLSISLESGPDVINEDGVAVFVFSVRSGREAPTAAVADAPTFGTMTITTDHAGIRRTSALTTAGASSDAERAQFDQAADAQEAEATTITATYTPEPDAFGTDGATLHICIADDCEAVSISVEVNAVPDAPRLSSTETAVSFVRGERVDIAVPASDPDGDALTFAADGLPDGLTMSAVGEISGVTNEPAGDGAFTVTITDNATPPLTTEVDIAFTISDPPNPRSYEQQLIISSARHHSSNGDDLIDEFVEITNVSDGPIDLAGMSLSDFASGDNRDRAIKYGVEVDTSFHFEIPAADRSRRPSVLPPGGTARIWVSEPCGTTFTIGETEVATQAVGHGGLATLEYSLVEANWHRLDLHADELWLRTSAGDVEDFVRWHSADTPAGSAPEWWAVPSSVENAWATAGPGTVVRFDHDRTHRPG